MDIKKIEEELRQSELRYRTIIDQASDAIMITDSTGTFIDVNSCLCKMFGYSREELLGANISKLIDPEQLSRDPIKFDVIMKGQSVLRERRMMHKDGTIIEVEANVKMSPDNKVVAIARDITARKKAEEEINRSHEQLRQLSSHLQKIREEERTNISREIHDVLGHQLTSLKMDATLLIKKISPENKEAREKISNMISLIDETVKNVRQISSKLRPGILDDLGLIDTISWHCNDFENRTGIRSRFNSQLEEKIFDKNLETEIFRVYQEALTNISRHSQATEITTTLESDENVVILKIEDNGKGFDESEVKNKKTLGLTGMKERAGMLGGKFTIKSNKGTGTAIVLEIPLKISPGKNNASGIRILIADDHNIVRRGIKEFLLEGFPDAYISEVSNGVELVQMARQSRWDLVISDVSMPGRNGLESLKQLKEEFPSLPVLILSMHPEEQYAIRAIRAGAAGYMTKESAPEELVNAVSKILSGKRYISTTLADKLAEILETGSSDEMHESLSDREFDVLKLIASGKTVSEIADVLSLSVTTVSTYRARILFKMKLRTNAEMTHYAIQNKLV